MALILFCTVIGFFVGLAYVIRKRKIRPGKVLAATFAGLLAAGILKIIKDNYKRKRF